MICLEVSEVSDDRVQDALARLAADQEGSLPGLLGFLWTHASRGEISGRLEVEKQHLAPTGFLHAATVVALADTACGYGCLQSVPEGGDGFRDCGAQREFHWYGARGRRHLQRPPRAWRPHHSAMGCRGQGRALRQDDRIVSLHADPALPRPRPIWLNPNTDGAIGHATVDV